MDRFNPEKIMSETSRPWAIWDCVALICIQRLTDNQCSSCCIELSEVLKDLQGKHFWVEIWQTSISPAIRGRKKTWTYSELTRNKACSSRNYCNWHKNLQQPPWTQLLLALHSGAMIPVWLSVYMTTLSREYNLIQSYKWIISTISPF